MELLDAEAIIKAYNSGESMRAISIRLNTYPTSIRRVLERHGVDLRHDKCKKGDPIIQNGEKLIEWAKAQKRLVTKAELAASIGRKRLSPSYFEKYPELSQYIVSYGQHSLQDYIHKLYKWLQDNDIKYKPNDKTKIKTPVTAWLLEDYSNIVLQIAIKPKDMSVNRHKDKMRSRAHYAEENGVTIIFLNEKHFEDLDVLKDILESHK